MRTAIDLLRHDMLYQFLRAASPQTMDDRLPPRMMQRERKLPSQDALDMWKLSRLCTVSDDDGLDRLLTAAYPVPAPPPASPGAAAQ